MNLVVDIGNTRTKAALYNGTTLVESRHYAIPNDVLNDISFIKQAQKAIIGTVVDNIEYFLNQLKSLIPTQLFTTQTPIPLINRYQTASTLGSDRLAAAMAAYYLYPNTNTLTIDAGTCIKYNFTTIQNEYIGGGISPGILMRFKALHHFTSKLPLIDPDFSYSDLIGNNTHNSILSGVLNGASAEVDEIINRYKVQYPNLLCVLTGGDSEYLSKQLKNTIFTHQNLVLAGLNHILNYNLENHH